MRTLITVTLAIIAVDAASLLKDAIDLAYDSTQGLSVTYPLHTKFKLTIKLRGQWGNSGLYVENNDIEQGEHAGTHIDAPAHFIKGGWRVHQIPLEKFSGPAVVIDITEKARLE